MKLNEIIAFYAVKRKLDAMDKTTKNLFFTRKEIAAQGFPKKDSALNETILQALIQSSVLLQMAGDSLQ